MNRIFYAAMLLLGLSILCSCNKENNRSSGSIIGEWQSTKREYVFQGSVVETENYDKEKYVFYDNGNVMASHYEDTFYVPYLYDTKLGRLTIMGLKWNITLTSSTMVLTDKDDTIYDEVKTYFSRVK